MLIKSINDSMQLRKFTNIGIDVPLDFPIDDYESVNRIVGKKITSNRQSFDHYGASWNAVAYRFVSFQENNNSFTQSIIKDGVAPTHINRYNQEKSLFYFFSASLSTIESACYALYAIASIVNPNEFQLGEKDLRGISPESVKKLFDINFPNEKITLTLSNIINDANYQEFKTIRNTLMHRTAPPRIFKGDDATWALKDITIDDKLTSTRYTWLVSILSELINAILEFTNRHIL